MTWWDKTDYFTKQKYYSRRCCDVSDNFSSNRTRSSFPQRDTPGRWAANTTLDVTAGSPSQEKGTSEGGRERRTQTQRGVVGRENKEQRAEWQSVLNSPDSECHGERGESLDRVTFRTQRHVSVQQKKCVRTQSPHILDKPNTHSTLSSTIRCFLQM